MLVTDIREATVDLVGIDYSVLAAGIRRVRDTIADVEATADSPDGLVQATVDGRGRLLALRLSPLVYRELGSAALAESVVDTVTAAVALASHRVLARSRECTGRF
jgi:DNA-binding protein YbaB